MAWNCFYSDQEDDSWKRQHLEQENSHLRVYQLINVRKETGDLLKLYDEENEEPVRSLCDGRVRECLYNNGEYSHTVTYEDFQHWQSDKLEDNEERAEGHHRQNFYRVEQMMERFEEHEACWKLEERGTVGETPLHLCLLKNSDRHLRIARVLLDMFPDLSKDIYEGKEYYGESALHFAIVHGNLEAVKLLVEKGANIHQRATGTFFLPEDQKITPPRSTTNYEGYAYYGEYPLAFAASCGFTSIYDYLIENGADPNKQDSFGNTVLHLTVIKNRPDMYAHAAKHHLRKADQWIHNRSGRTVGTPEGEESGLTPLCLACKLGRGEVFSRIMELQKLELWRFSRVNCCIYPLHAVDSIGSSGQMNWNSALMITLNGKTEDHVDMLQSGVLRYLLDQKWKLYVKKRFFVQLAILLMHLVSLTTSVWLRRKTDAQLMINTGDYFRLLAEILMVVACSFFLAMQIYEIRLVGLFISLYNLRNAPFKVVYLISCILQIALVPVRLASIGYLGNQAKLYSLQLAEETLLIITLPLCWSMLFYFISGMVKIGPLANFLLIYIRKDLLPILIIIVIGYTGFAGAFYTMFKSIPPAERVNVKTFDFFPNSYMSLFHQTYGEFEYDEFKLTKYPVLTMLVFVLFMFLLPILLLNMLIAMMTATFENLMRKSQKDWIHQWAKIIVAIERTFSDSQLLKFQEMYTDRIDDPAKVHKGIDGEGAYGRVERRRLMIIEPIKGAERD